MTDWAARATELDRTDPLRRFTRRFVRAPGVVSYLDGNSLGRPLRSFPALVRRFTTDEWGTRLIRAWDESWMSKRWIQTDPTVGVQLPAVSAALSSRTAVVVLSHVAYRSGAIADLAGITAAAHEVGALVLWDLCHSIGVVPITLDACSVDLAVGCSYKYLNGGPGSPAIGYVRASLQSTLRQPIWGWMGADDVFAMAPSYVPSADVRRFVSGTPPILAMLAVEAMLCLLEQAGIDAVRAKSLALGSFAAGLVSDHLQPLGVTLASPADPALRGGHLTVAHPLFRQLLPALWARGVIPDFRSPNGLRLGLSPLSTTFAEVEVGIRAVGEELTSALRDAP